MQEKNYFQKEEIGFNARLIDTTMSIQERMKLDKSSLKRIAGAILCYLLIMTIFLIIL